jgi:flavin-dependent dehydrogenase
MIDRRFDVAIIGGGLAGGMAATLLSRRGLSTVVLEARAPDKAQKVVVGEALTEGTSVFLRHELGLEGWLKQNAFRKFGFDFLTLPRGAAPARSLEDCHELLLSLTPMEHIPGALRKLIPTYHVDRPPLNRHLGELARAAGARWLDAASVEHVDTDGAPGPDHRIKVHYRGQGGEAAEVECRFVLDCSGRRCFLGKQLGIHHPFTKLNTASVWNRFTGVGADPAVWRTFQGVDRRRHTIHGTGQGFWIWWIHLSETMTSVGISYDRDQHQPDVKAEDRGFREMIRKFPPLADQLADAVALEPYQYYAHLPYDSEHWVSPRGYALIGDAAWFTDALYSVGIETACRQLANLAPLVVERCRSGQMNEADCERLNDEFEWSKKSIQKMNLFKYQQGWHRPHVVMQTAVYELGDIRELYHVQDKAQWTPDNIARYYQLPWYTRERFQNLSDFLDDSVADGERDLAPGAPLLKKALLPAKSVYWVTWPLWKIPGGTALFFNIIRAWAFSERMTQRYRLWPDVLARMARKGARMLAAMEQPKAALPESAGAGSANS